LRDFSADQVLKQAVYSFIAAKLLSKEEKEEFTRIFKAFDKDADGKLTLIEFKNGYLEH
jgi:Ca2+-binding EF-hand superfamily protein